MLLILPNLLGEHKHHQLFLPASVDKAMASIDGLIAESDQAARRYLKRFSTKLSPQNMPVALFNEHTPDDGIDFLLEPLLKNERWGLLSDAGLPCIADPGSKLVFRARQIGIPIQVFVGPSSIIQALLLSGLPGQHFAFHGYTQRDSKAQKGELQMWEKNSKKENSTQIFIERPYQNKETLETALETLGDQTLLCVAWNLTMPDQGILSQPVGIWKKSPLPNLDKKPAIFLFCA